MAEVVAARSVAVLADCHIHPAHGTDWPQAALAALAGDDLIITLGDMGEGLAALGAIAQVIGVRGADDAEDARAAPATRVLEVGAIRIGCIFDPVAGELVASASPMTLSDEAVEQAFEGPIDVLLWASTHAPSVAHDGRRLLVNPGSATLPAEGSAPSFARLRLDGGRAQAEIVALT